MLLLLCHTLACGESGDSAGDGGTGSTPISEESLESLCENIPFGDYSSLCFAIDELSFTRFLPDDPDVCIWDFRSKETEVGVYQISLISASSDLSVSQLLTLRRNAAIEQGVEVVEISDLGDDAFTSQNSLNVKVGSLLLTLAIIRPEDASVGCGDLFAGAVEMARIVISNINLSLGK